MLDFQLNLIKLLVLQLMLLCPLHQGPQMGLMKIQMFLIVQKIKFHFDALQKICYFLGVSMRKTPQDLNNSKVPTSQAWSSWGCWYEGSEGGSCAKAKGRDSRSRPKLSWLFRCGKSREEAWWWGGLNCSSSTKESWGSLQNSLFEVPWWNCLSLG